MHCSRCNTKNDPDAVFCVECGKPLHADAANVPVKFRRSYLFIIVLAPVLALVAGIGYYKFFLPDGVAAVVTGDEIKISELDAEMTRVQGKGDASSDRLRLLNHLITERIVLQEARKAGMSGAGEEISFAAREARASSGLDDGSFKQEITSRYGNMRTFESALERRLLIDKLIAEKVVPPGADAGTARSAVSKWMRDLSGRAAVRIALSEQGAGPGCGCCNKGGGPANQATAAEQSPASDKARAAADACLQYWHAKYGPDAVTTRLTDYGCHYQVDIEKNGRIIGSLRYQGGTITETEPSRLGVGL